MSTSKINVQNTNINTRPGVDLSSDQQAIIGSILDLFSGRPSLEKLQLWTDDAIFEDPLTQARGREQFEPQWYGLQTAFLQIERLAHEVTAAGNPISMQLRQRYVLKGLRTATTISSVVNVFTDDEGRVTRVEDRWDGTLPDGKVVNAFRRLNAVSIPHMVSVPKDMEEDMRRGS